MGPRDIRRRPRPEPVTFRSRLTNSVAVGRDDDGPFQILAKLFGANLPLTERLGFGLANLNDGPVAGQCQGGRFVRARAA